MSVDKFDIYADDYYRMTGKRYKRSIKTYLESMLHHNLRYMYWFRKYQRRPLFIYRLMLFRLTRKYGLEISVSAKIGKGLYLGHPYNITVGGDVVLGNNVNLHKGCTIGRTNGKNRGGSPKIGDRVFVGINSTLVGDIHIGNDVMIAANSFVNFDVPDHSVVLGNPATIHHKENATEAYISFFV